MALQSNNGFGSYGPNYPTTSPAYQKNVLNSDQGFSAMSNPTGSFGPSDQTRAGQLYQTGNQQAFEKGLQANQIGGENYRAQVGANAQMLPSVLANARFNQLLPWIMGQFGAGQAPGGANGTPPPITTGPVYDPNQIQQQVNATRAQNDASTASQVRGMQDRLSGQGLGSQSPLAQSLATAMQGQNLATNTGAEQQLRFNAAGANSQQLLNSQNALQNQFATQQQQDIERRKVTQAHIGNLLGLLGSYSR